YLEQQNLANLINFTLPVEAPTALGVRTTTLSVYTCPADPRTGVFMVISEIGDDLAPAATNSYAACYGAGGIVNSQPDSGNGIFYRNSRTRIQEISDGTSTTIAIGERAALFTQTPWAGAMTGGTARTTPGAPVWQSFAMQSPTQVLARVGTK